MPKAGRVGRSGASSKGPMFIPKRPGQVAPPWAAPPSSPDPVSARPARSELAKQPSSSRGGPGTYQHSHSHATAYPRSMRRGRPDPLFRLSSRGAVARPPHLPFLRGDLADAGAGSSEQHATGAGPGPGWKHPKVAPAAGTDVAPGSPACGVTGHGVRVSGCPEAGVQRKWGLSSTAESPQESGRMAEGDVSGRMHVVRWKEEGESEGGGAGEGAGGVGAESGGEQDDRGGGLDH